MQIFVSVQGVTYGPFSPDEIRKRINNGEIQSTDYACLDNINWITISELEKLNVLSPKRGVLPAKTLQPKPVLAKKSVPNSKFIKLKNSQSHATIVEYQTKMPWHTGIAIFSNGHKCNFSYNLKTKSFTCQNGYKPPQKDIDAVLFQINMKDGSPKQLEENSLWIPSVLVLTVVLFTWYIIYNPSKANQDAIDELDRSIKEGEKEIQKINDGIEAIEKIERNVFGRCTNCESPIVKNAVRCKKCGIEF